MHVVDITEDKPTLTNDSLLEALVVAITTDLLKYLRMKLVKSLNSFQAFVNRIHVIGCSIFWSVNLKHARTHA